MTFDDDIKPSGEVLSTAPPLPADTGWTEPPAWEEHPEKVTVLSPALIKADTVKLSFTADKSTGKMRVQANQFEDTKVIERGRQWIIRYVEGQVQVFDAAQ